MGKLIASFLLILLSPFYGMGEETLQGTVEYSEGQIYVCRMGESVVLELPAAEKYALDTQGSSDWEVEGEFNFVWISPKTPDAILHLVIRDSQNRQLALTFKSTRTGETPFKKIVVKELKSGVPTSADDSKKSSSNEVLETRPSSSSKKLESPGKKDSSQPVATAESESSEQDADRDFVLETQFNLSGGIFAINDKNNFNVRGEIVVAGKSKPGLLGQFSALVDINSFQKRFGQSLGAGFENRNLGFFLFADMLETKLDQFNTTIHYQVRPTVRFRNRKIQAAGFFAMALSQDQFTGTEDEADPTLGVFNRAISHLGFEFDVLLMEKILLHGGGLIGTSSIYKISAGLEVNLFKNINLVAALHKANYGDYPLLLDASYGDSFAFNMGIIVGMGNRLKFNDQRTRIILPRDYPLVVNTLKKVEKKSAGSSLEISLTANPEQGYSPLAVTFQTQINGGVAPYHVELYPMWKRSALSLSNTAALGHLYTEPGTYIAKATVTDKNGLKAESNEVTITVLKSDKTQWNIVVISGPGGAVTPGTSQVADGEDSPVFSIQPNSGYEIDYVLIDGKNEGKLTIHQFKVVHANHELQAYFKTSGGSTTKYTITATSGSNGTISPAGAVQVEKGANQTFTCTGSDASYDIDKILVDGLEVAADQPSPYTYTFPNVQSDHTIHVMFKIRKFTIHVDFTGPGHTDPGFGDYQVNYGGSFTINNVPDSEAEGDYLTVDGIWTTYQSSYTFYNVTANHNYYARFKSTPPPTKKWKVTVEEQYILNGNPAGFGYWDSTYDEGLWANIYFYHEHPAKPGFFLIRVLVDNVDQPLDVSGGYRFYMQMYQNHEIKVVYEKVE